MYIETIIFKITNIYLNRTTDKLDMYQKPKSISLHFLFLNLPSHQQFKNIKIKTKYKYMTHLIWHKINLLYFFPCLTKELVEPFYACKGGKCQLI